MGTDGKTAFHIEEIAHTIREIHLVPTIGLQVAGVTCPEVETIWMGTMPPGNDTITDTNDGIFKPRAIRWRPETKKCGIY